MSGRSAGSAAGLIIGGIIGYVLAPATGGASAVIASIGLGASLGSAAGGLAGGLYDSANTKFDDVVNRQERLADLAVQSSTLGIPIPQIWGKIGGLAGNVIWATNKVPHEMREVIESEAAKGGPSGPRQVNITITYTQSYALNLCDTRLSGPIEGISKIYKNSNLYWDRGMSGQALPDGWTFYNGDPMQPPDPTIEADKGVGAVPRYPYLCYVVVADDDQGRSGQTPVYNFELFQSTAGTNYLSAVAVSGTTNDVWVASPQLEQVHRFDEATRGLAAVVQLGPTTPGGFELHAPLAIDSSGGVWTGDRYNNTVYRIDGSSNAIIATIDLGDAIPASNIVFSGGDAWIAGLNALSPTTVMGVPLPTLTVHRLTNAGGNTVIATGTGGNFPRLAVGADGHIWLADTVNVAGVGIIEKRVLRIDPASDTIVADIAGIAGAHDVLADAAGTIWVAYLEGDSIYKINPATNLITATLSVTADPTRLGLASDGFLWVSSQSSKTVNRINTTTNAVQSFTANGQADPSQFEEAWAAAAGGSMWVIDNYANTATLITSAGVTMAVRTSRQPVSIAAGASNSAWVTSSVGGNLQHITSAGASAGQVTGNDLPSLVTTLCNAVGLTDIDVTDMPDDLVSIVLLNVEAARVPIEQLAEAYRFYAVESGFDLKFRERGSGALVFSIPEEELGAGDGQADETGLRVQRAQEADLPTSIDVQYVDPDQNYQRNTQPGQLALPASGIENARSINVGSIALKADSARQLATERAVEAWAARETLQGTVRRKYAWLEPGDRGTITARGLTYTAVLTETSYGAPGLVEFTARVDAGYIRNALIAVPGIVVPMSQTPPVVGDTTPVLMNLYALNNMDQAPRFHVAYIGETEPWEGGALYRSTDGGASYGQIDFAVLEGITGTVALATADADWHTIDENTIIRVVVEYGSLSSITDAQLYEGGNLCAIGNETNGWEILQFSTVTLISEGVYDLTRLLRGRRGTEHEVSGHGVNEKFILLDAGVRDISMEPADIGMERLYKAVTAGQDISTVSSTTFIPTAANLTLLSVAHPTAVRVGNDWHFFWYARSRFHGPGTEFQGIAFDPDFISFYVRIATDNSYAVIAHDALTDGGSPFEANVQMTWIYDEASQIADFGSAQSTLYYGIYQYGNSRLSVAENKIAA